MLLLLDAVLALTTANAILQICDINGTITTMEMSSFINYSYDEFKNNGFFIVGLIITENNPIVSINSNPVVVVTETFKVAQRTSNAHAHVNAGFQFLLQKRLNSPPICTSSRIVFGGVSKKIFIAKKTENILLNAPITYNTLQLGLTSLLEDLKDVGYCNNYGSQDFRISVMNSFFYKALLRCYSIEQLQQNLISAVIPWIKPVSRGTEVFLPSGPEENEKPVTKYYYILLNYDNTIYYYNYLN